MRTRNIFILALVVLAAGCTDDLDRFPLDEPSDATFFSTEAELTLAINGVYHSLWWHIGSHPAHQNLDNTTDIGFLRDGGIRDLADGSGTSTSAGPEDFWTDLYAGISRANTLLTNMERAKDVVTEAKFVEIQAEAKFLRAYFYHHLTELFGDVPLLETQPSLDESQIGRSPKSEVAALMFSDLNFAADHLPVTWSGKDVGRATKGAALTLLARVALYNNNYDLAIEASQEVMDLKVYSLHDDYEELFQYEGIRNAEVILDLPYLQGIQTHSYPQRAGSRMLGAFSTVVPSQFMIDSYLASDGETIDKSAVYNPAKPFENRDPRLAASIVYPQSILDGYIFETHPDSTKTWRVEDGVKVARVTNQDVTNAFATFTGYLWRKYSSPLDYPEKNRDSELNFILMRYAEVLLIYAEAKIESNDIDQSVVDAMNKIRARAYGVDYTDVGNYPEITIAGQAEMRRILRNERKVELACEGFRLYDIRRWKIADSVMDGPLVGRPITGYETIPEPPVIDEATGHPAYGASLSLYRQVIQRTFRARDWLYPIPQSEVNVNKSIKQNPGY